MKVVFAMRYSPRPSWGVENVAYNLVQGFSKIRKTLERKGIEITIVSGTGKKLKPEKRVISGFDFVFYKELAPITVFGDVQHTLLSKGYFRQMLSSADLVHSHVTTFSLSVANVFPDKPVLHNFHGLPWNEKDFLNEKYLKLMYDLMTARCKRLAGLDNVVFIAISRFVKKDVGRTLGVVENKIHVVYDPVSDEFFNIEKKKTSDNLVFYPARLIPRKNHLPLIEALGLLKKEQSFDGTLVLTGNVEDRSYFSLIQQVIKKYNLDQNVVFLGEITKGKLFEQYSKASIVVLTSLEESFSLAVAEAMATGTPVVASPVGVVPEAVVDGKNGYIIDPTNPKDIAEKIRIVIEDGRRRKIMGRSAKKTAEKWRSENIVRELIKIYLSVGSHPINDSFYKF